MFDALQFDIAHKLSLEIKSGNDALDSHNPHPIKKNYRSKTTISIITKHILRSLCVCTCVQCQIIYLIFSTSDKFSNDTWFKLHSLSHYSDSNVRRYLRIKGRTDQSHYGVKLLSMEFFLILCSYHLMEKMIKKSK